MANCNANRFDFPPDPTLMTRCSLNQSEQREFASRMERKQMKEFMTVRSILPEPPVDGIFDLPPRCSGIANANAPSDWSQ
jgi:hypothetical protein